MATPWLTSTDIINAIKRRISFPVYQSTFTDQELLEFANDVMKDELMPNMLKYHQEYFVKNSTLTVIANKSSYPIPNRAIGMKLRDLFYADGNAVPGLPYGNLFEMTRANADDKAWFNAAGVANQTLYKYYLEDNSIVVLPSITIGPTGLLVFSWMMRPNQLVENSRAFIVSGFSKTIIIDNTLVLAGDTITLSVVEEQETTDYVFTAVAGAPGAFEFQIGATSSATATNLVTSINTADIGFSGNNGSPATNVAKIVYSNRPNTIAASNTAAFEVQEDLGIESDDPVPSNIVGNTYLDLLQTLPGHKIINWDVFIDPDCISGNTLCLPEDSVDNSFQVGDYICSRNECIIPQLPPELHSSLVQRACSKILEAIGDKEGMAVSDQKVQKLDANEGNLVANRVDGAPQKVLNRFSLLRYNGFNRFRY